MAQVNAWDVEDADDIMDGFVEVVNVAIFLFYIYKVVLIFSGLMLVGIE